MLSAIVFMQIFPHDERAICLFLFDKTTDFSALHPFSYERTYRMISSDTFSGLFTLSSSALCFWWVPQGE